MKPAEVWLVRHGETEWTLTKQHTGRTDIELTAEGVRQAESLAGALGRESFARVLTSPLKRARQTAELAGFGDAEPVDDLMEVDYGDYEGLTTVEIRRERPDWLLWRDGSPGGESIEQVGERADRVLAALDGVEGKVLLFGHGHLSRVLGARLLGLPPADGRLLLMSPGSLNVIGSEHDYRAIKTWNREKT